MTNKTVNQREYKVFRNYKGEYIIIWTDMQKQCIYNGRDLEELERGYFPKDENQLKSIMSFYSKYNKKG